MQYNNGKNFWATPDNNVSSLSPAPINGPTDRYNITNGFIGGNKLAYIAFAPPITFLQIATLNNFSYSTQNGIAVGSINSIIPAYKASGG